MIEYDQAFRVKLAGELATVDPHGALAKWMVDSERLRGEVRACQGKPA